MNQQKAEIKLALQASVDVLNAAKDGPEADWLVLDNEKAQAAMPLIEIAIAVANKLYKQPKIKKALIEFCSRSINTLTYTEATISILNNDTSEAHRGRTDSALEQLNQLLQQIDEAFLVN